MCFVWLSTAFGYNLIFMLVNTFENVYLTAFTSSASEMIAYGVAGIFYQRIGVKLSLILAFAISTFGGIVILFWGLDHQESVIFYVLILLAKFGVSCTFNINFLANNFFFPTLFAATALGICNFLARLFASTSFIVSGLT